MRELLSGASGEVRAELQGLYENLANSQRPNTMASWLNKSKASVVLAELGAGLDVHKDTVVACVRAPDPGGGRLSEVRTFGTFTVELLALRDWLLSHRVSLVAMESTGVYWRPVFYVLTSPVTRTQLATRPKD